MSPPSEIFRSEVIEYRRDRLHGTIILSHSKAISVLTCLIFAITVAIGGLLFMRRFARIESVPGVLITTAPTVKIIPPRPGTVLRMRVRDGSLVRRGDPLAVVLTDRQSVSGENVADTALSTVNKRIAFSVLDRRAIDDRLQGENRRVAASIASVTEQIVNIGTQIELQKQLVAADQGMYERLTTLVSKGFVSNVEVERRHEALINAQQGLVSLTQQRVALIAQIEDARSRLVEAQVQHDRDLISVASNTESLRQQHVTLEGDRAYVIESSASGRISSLQANVGSAVSGNSPILYIVPDQSSLHAEIYVPSRAIGFVHVGEEVRLLYDAYPYQRFGSFKGTISLVSRTVVDPREMQLPVKLEEPAYRVIVKLERQAFNLLGRQVQLQPGSSLTANIVLERQTFFDWVLSPLRSLEAHS